MSAVAERHEALERGVVGGAIYFDQPSRPKKVTDSGHFTMSPSFRLTFLKNGLESCQCLLCHGFFCFVIF